ncbi:hypothetical protein, partial [Lactiplantibacillus argentoratensis]|uniref:hypothetical protein n=1 Tax=Lactiplantibacillus argentoratensis TaxID=271881 RepID=UPI0007091E3B
ENRHFYAAIFLHFITAMHIYEYKVGKESVTKIDLPDSNGFVAVHKDNNKTEYIKAPYMKFCTDSHV